MRVRLAGRGDRSAWPGREVAVRVASLVERELVCRSGPGGRGRRSGLAVTAAGRALYEAALTGVVEYHGVRSSGLTPTQLTTLETLRRNLANQ